MFETFIFQVKFYRQVRDVEIAQEKFSWAYIK